MHTNLTAALARSREGELRSSSGRPERLMARELELQLVRAPSRRWRRRAA